MKSKKIPLFILFLATLLLGAAPGYADNNTITVWSWFIQGTMDKAIKAFEAKHPGIKVNYSYYNYSPEYLTALKVAAASGSLPDLIGLQPGSLTQQYRPFLTPLNDLAAKKWGSNWTDNIYPIALKQMAMGNPYGDDNYYIMPHESQVVCIWYNTQLFRQLNIAVPRTYADLVKASKTLKSKGYAPMFQGAADGWQNENVFLMLANQYSPGEVDKAQIGQSSWTSPTLLKAMTAWSKLFKDGVFQAGAVGAHAYPTGAQLFAQGRVGMMALGSWWLQESKFAPPLPPLIENMKGFDYFYMPPVEAGNAVSPPVGGIDIGYGLTNNGAKNPLAFEFLASLVNGEGEAAMLNDLNDLPAFKGFRPTDAPVNVMEMFTRFSNDVSKAQNQRFAYPAVAEALDNALAGVAVGKLTPAAALKHIQAITDKTLGK